LLEAQQYGSLHMYLLIIFLLLDSLNAHATACYILWVHRIAEDL